MRYVAICFALLVSACTVFAQTGGTGSISGTVSDPSGAIVSGAAVEGTNNATGIKTDTVTTDAGLFVLTQLQPGTYTVTVTATGFESLKQEHVIVDALQVVTLDPKLTVGAATQYVTVSSQPTMLQADDTHLGQSMDNDVYDSLPLAMTNNQARDPAFFASLVVGVTATSFQPTGTDLNSFNGGQQFQNEIYVEGLPISSIGTGGDTRNVSFGMSVEAIEQFQVQTAGGEAMYEGQGVENFVVKSGTNGFHGGVFEYFRNTDFDARSFFNTNRPVEHQNEFGGTFGGPVKKNKMFFFGSYDGYRFQTGIAPAQQTIPTAAMLSGDFSALNPNNLVVGAPGVTGVSNIYQNTCTSTACTSTQYMCPTTSTNATNAGKLNIIPGTPACPVSGVANPISSVSQSLASYLPSPSASGITNNFLAEGLVQKVDQDTTTEKVDFDLSSRNRLSVVYSFGRYLQPVTGSFTAGTSELPIPYLQARTVEEHVSTINVHETFTINPNLVNDIGYSYSRLFVPEFSDTSAGNYPVKAGLTNLPPGIASEAFPTVNFAGSVTIPTSWAGTNANISTEVQQTYTLQDNLMWTKNRNHVTFGFQWQALEDNDNNPQTGSLASFSFSANETGQVSGTAVVANTGNAFASYLLGLVDSSSITENSFAESGGRYKDYAPYVQDDIKVSDRLTLNLGLRWDIWSPYTETLNRESWFDPNVINPLTNTPGGLMFDGFGTDACQCTTMVATDMKNFGPRVGLAYRIGDKTVIRASYGIFYTHAGGTGGRTDGRQGLGFLGLSFANAMSSPFAGAPAYNWSTGGSGGGPGVPGGTLVPPFITHAYGTGAILATAPGAAAVGASPTNNPAFNYPDPILSGIPPSYQNITFQVQHSFTPNMTLSVAYAGSLARHLAGAGVAGEFTNQIPTTYLSIGPMMGTALNPTNAVSVATTLRTAMVADAIPIPSWIGPVANPCTLCLPYPNFSSTVGQALKPFPQILSLGDPWADVGDSDYNALQISFSRRMSHGLTFTGNFVYSQVYDDIAGVRMPGEDSLEWAPDTTIDHPIVASGSLVDQLPFGYGHMMSSKNRAVNALVSNWQVVAVYTFTSGAPLAVTATCTGDSIIDAACVPNIVANSTTAWAQGIPNPGDPGTIIGNIPAGSPAGTKDTVFLNPAVFTNPSRDTFGTAPRSAPLNLYGYNLWDLDLNIRRVIPIHESYKLTIQADCFNVPNIVNFTSPTVGAFTGGTYGTITSQANQPRKLQFSARFDF